MWLNRNCIVSSPLATVVKTPLSIFSLNECPQMYMQIQFLVCDVWGILKFNSVVAKVLIVGASLPLKLAWTGHSWAMS